MTPFDPGFTTPTMAAAFAPAARVAAMCRFEAALAAASADAGLVDGAVAAEITRACEADIEDPEAVLLDGWQTGTPVIPLLEVLRRRLSDQAAATVHHGATTQDVVDTASMLQAREGLQLLRSGLVAVATRLRGLAERHRDDVVQGWTFLQAAAPTTVGLRVAAWLEPTVRHVAAARTLPGDLPVQLGGPTGTLAALGADADRVVAGVADRLGLAVPTLPWHTDRSRLAEVVALLERISRTMATIGADLALLAHAGAARMRAGGSSSMPGKRNPIDAVRAVAAADACAGVSTIVTGGRPHELERGVGGWHAEWFAVPLAFQTCAAAVEAVETAVDTLEFVPDDITGEPSPAAVAAVDRVVARCDEEMAR